MNPPPGRLGDPKPELKPHADCQPGTLAKELKTKALLATLHSTRYNSRAWSASASGT